MANLENDFILIAGSISHKTEKRFVDRAHAFTRALTKSILDANGGLVVYLAGEPKNDDGDLLTFDWTVANEASALASNYTPARQMKIVTSLKAMSEKMSEEQRMFIRRLQAKKFAEIIYIDDDLVTGGNIGDEQVEVATAMIAIGGGRGVSDRAHKMRRKRLPVLPFDLQVGGFSDDGVGAIGLHKAFFSDPLSMFPITGEQVKGELGTLSLQEPIFPLEELAEMTVGLFQAEREAEQASRTPDVLILTALSVELASAKLACGIQDETPHRRSANYIHYWTTILDRHDGPVSCAIASLGSAGNVNAGNITTQLLSELKPKKVLMMGIAGGLRGKMTLGEAIVSERVVYYESAAALADGVLAARPEMQRPGMATLQDLSTYFSSPSLSDRLQERAKALGVSMPKESAAGEVAPKFKASTATIVSGEKLIRDSEFFARLRQIHDKACVAEMEAYGVVDACEKQNVPVLVVRGISDFGDDKKDDLFHKVASDAAAIVVVDYIIHGWSRALGH